MALSAKVQSRSVLPSWQDITTGSSWEAKASEKGQSVFQARHPRQTSAKRQEQNLRKGILGRKVGPSKVPSFVPSFDAVREKSRWSMKAVMAPPGKSKEYLPPPEDTATGWEAGVIGVERRINHALTDIVVVLLDAFYADRHYARFYVLETIARVPYFSYVSVLHMYESFGWWRRADYIKVHFAESWNELHHLLIMESLGGDRRWIDRFLAQHVAVVYYVLCCVIYLVSPRMAYHLMECVETHAYHTYDTFLAAFGDKLKTKPAPEVAVKYYTDGDLYMFDEFQTAATPGVRRPKIENLYDVFVNVRDDEGEHCKTMRACQTAGSISSPHHDTPVLPGDLCSGVVECSTTAVSAADRYLKHGVPIDDTL